jgi:peroxin-6
MLKAITRAARLVDQKLAAHNKTLPPNTTPITIAHFFDHLATDEDTNVTVAEEDFDAARRELVPSVSYEELQHYEGVRKAFEGDGAQKTIENNNSGKEVDVRNSKPTSGKAAAPRLGSNTSANRGKGREKALGPSQHHGSAGAVFDAEDDDDEDPYVIRTGHLGVNGNGNGNGHASGGGENGGIVHKGKGKGKGSLGFSGQAFGDAAGNDEEELYS